MNAAQDPLLQQAIDWMVRLGSGEASAADAQHFEAWKARDPRHAAAWAQVHAALEQTFSPMRRLRAARPERADTARRALLRKPERRRVIKGALALAAVGAGTGLIVRRQQLGNGLFADVDTGTAQRRSLVLADGSRLTLDARSAIDLHYDTAQRRVRLREGALIAQVAADAARPFVVQARHGQAQALGTRFLVRQEARRTLVVVLEHRVRISAAAQQRELHAGQGAWLGDGGIEMLDGDARFHAAWADGWLEARDQPLGEVVEALRPYVRGHVRVEPQAARLRVLGAYPLDRPEQTLAMLADTLPIRLRRYGPLTLIESR